MEKEKKQQLKAELETVALDDCELQDVTGGRISLVTGSLDNSILIEPPTTCSITC